MKLSALLIPILLTGCASAQLTFKKPLTPQETEDVQSWVAASLKDPESARFNPGTYAVVNQDNVLQWYCGTVNGKNSYGGYSGYQNFLAQGPGRSWLQQSDGGFIDFGGCFPQGGDWPGIEQARAMHSAYKSGVPDFLKMK